MSRRSSVSRKAPGSQSAPQGPTRAGRCLYRRMTVTRGCGLLTLHSMMASSMPLITIKVSFTPWTCNAVRRPGVGDGYTYIGSNTVMETMYLVESRGDLLMVLRGMLGVLRSRIPRGEPCLVDVDGRNRFRVFRADFARSRWTEVSTLGDDQVLFLCRQFGSADLCLQHGSSQRIDR